MAITDTQKVDYLFKKIGYGISKTDVSTVKSPSNETIASPLILRGDIIWQQGASIPAVQPSSNTGVVTVYSDANTNTVQTTADATATQYRTWKTNLIDWISPEYGSTYQVQVYLDTTGSTTPQTTGTRIYPDGTGNNDEWYFDYSSGVLNFIGTNLPSVTWTGKSIFIVGSRYTGQKGLVNFPGGMTIGNVNINGNTIGIVNTNGNLVLTANGAGYVTTSNTIASSLQVTNNSNFYANLSVGGNVNITGNTTIGGNLQVNGDIVGFSANTITMFDSLLYIASNNTTSDLVDIGVVGHYNDGTSAHTGIIRDSGTKEYYFFKGYTAEPSVNNIDINDPSFTLANLNVSNLKVYGGTTLSSSGLTGNAITVSSTTGNITLVTTGLVNVQANTALRLPSGSVSSRPATTEAGQIRYNTDTNIIEYFNGTAWIAMTNSVDVQSIQGDGVNNVFTLSQPADPSSILVSINGTMQQPYVAYTVSGNQLTLVEIPLVTDVIDIRFIAALVSLDKATIESEIVTASNAINANLLITNANVTAANVEIGKLRANITAANTAIVNITNGTTTFGNIVPSANVTYSLGSPTAMWKSLYVSSNTIYIGGTALGLNNGQLTIGGTSNIATTSYVDTAVSNLVNSSPSTLDTLSELATALNNDAGFATTTATAIGLRANIASPAFTGTPTAPTANIATSNTQLATTGFVHNMLPTGIITMWYGLTTNVPYGWYLCDGTNGTPDLRDRFVVGAGSTYAVSTTGGSKDAIAVSHTHTASSTTSTSITDPGHKHWISGAPRDDGNGTGAGSNGQMYGLWADAGSYSADDPNYSYGRYNSYASTGISASSSTSTTVNSAGSSGTNANLPPYYALCYIMKA